MQMEEVFQCEDRESKLAVKNFRCNKSSRDKTPPDLVIIVKKYRSPQNLWRILCDIGASEVAAIVFLFFEGGQENIFIGRKYFLDWR